jgi:hypothetical protein
LLAWAAQSQIILRLNSVEIDTSESLPPKPAGAFSAKVGAGFAKGPQGRVSENAVKQKDRAFARFSQIGGCSGWRAA